MHIGTFTPIDGWAGKTVEYDEARRVFRVQDHGPVSALQVLKYGTAPGHFEWASEEARALVEGELDPGVVAAQRETAEAASRKDAWIVFQRKADWEAEFPRREAAGGAERAADEALHASTSPEGVLLATVGLSTGSARKRITHDGDNYILEGHGTISADDVIEYERQRHLVWANAGMKYRVTSSAEWAAAEAERAAAQAEREAFALTRTLATFGPGSVHDGKRIVAQNDEFVLEGSGPVSPTEMAAFDRQGWLVWTSQELRSAVRSDAAFAEMPAKAQKTLATNMAFGLIDFVIVGAGSQCLVALSDNCVIVKPPSFMSLESCTQYSYADITAVSLHEVGDTPVIELTTPVYPASDLGSNFVSHPKRVANCLPLVSNGSMFKGEWDTHLDELRRRVGLQDPPRDVIARVSCCRVTGGEGIPLPEASAHAMVFCQDKLLLRRSVDGRPEVSIPYSDITLLEVSVPSGVVDPGGTGAARRPSGNILAQALTATMTGVYATVTLQTSRGEMFFHSRYEPQAVIRMRLSPVFNLLRQRQPAGPGAEGTQVSSEDLVDRLAKLAELHTDGALTDEEFENAKKRVLSPDATREQPSPVSTAPIPQRAVGADASEAQAPPREDPMQCLARLTELHVNGELTDKEFDALGSEILAEGLAELHADGAFSDEEFAAVRSGMTRPTLTELHAKGEFTDEDFARLKAKLSS